MFQCRDNRLLMYANKKNLRVETASGFGAVLLNRSRSLKLNSSMNYSKIKKKSTLLNRS